MDLQTIQALRTSPKVLLFLMFSSTPQDMDTIQRGTNQSKPTVRKALRELQELGLVVRARNGYRLTEKILSDVKKFFHGQEKSLQCEKIFPEDGKIFSESEKIFPESEKNFPRTYHDDDGDGDIYIHHHHHGGKNFTDVQGASEKVFRGVKDADGRSINGSALLWLSRNIKPNIAEAWARWIPTAPSEYSNPIGFMISCLRINTSQLPPMPPAPRERRRLTRDDFSDREWAGMAESNRQAILAGEMYAE